ELRRPEVTEDAENKTEHWLFACSNAIMNSLRGIERLRIQQPPREDRRQSMWKNTRVGLMPVLALMAALSCAEPAQDCKGGENCGMSFSTTALPCHGRDTAEVPLPCPGPCPAAITDAAGKDGAPPIGIASIVDLQKIGNDPAYPLTGQYVLTQDIDATETATW